MNYLLNFIFIFAFNPLFIMKCTDYESLLGKHITNTEDILGSDFDNKLFEKYFYYVKDENIKKNLYGIDYNSISILTDKNEIVESVTIHFLSTINKDVYDQLILKYGLRNEIKVIEKKVIVSENKINNEVFSQEIKKSNVELRNGSFEENPLYIIWHKDNFEIIIFTRHNMGISEITFKNKK